ncbi:MAG: hypothetical protein IJF69_06225 [Clostridia bacterium]|nr:hypothetical protein [Clostridia bacterium]
MTNKKTFSTELAYVLGILILALGTAFMEAADFGVSMVVAPAYILHLKISQYLPFFSFGMAEYSLQGVLIILTVIIVRRFKLSYLFSFVTAVLYGLVLDGFIFLVGFIPADSLFVRIPFFFVGMLFCSVGVSLFFHTYISPEAYELFVKEGADRFGVNIHRFKTGYDCTSCLISIVLSFAFFGFWHFEGVKLGTVFCALVNGFIIGRCTGFFEKHWDFRDKLPLRPVFEK